MEANEFEYTLMGLVDEVRVIFENEAAKQPAAADQVARALALMAELRPEADRPGGNALPGCRHLDRVLNLAEGYPTASVARALRQLAPALHWAQNPRYNDGNMGAGFLDNYGWSSLGLAGSDDLALGVLLLGPGVTYPPTSYESEGLFLVIGGSPEWKSGDQPWRRVTAGDVIRRPWNGSEGKRPGKEPMLALYAWMYREP